MEYNYYFEVVAIVILGILVYDVRKKKQLYRLDGQLFLWALEAQLVLSSIDLISCLMVKYAHMVAWGVNQLFCVLYFLMQPVAQLTYVLFIIVYTKRELSLKEFAVKFAVTLFGINALLSLLSAFFPLYFELSAAGVYSHGIVRNIPYYCYLFNMLLTALYALVNRQYLLRREVDIIAIGALIAICGGILQFAFHFSLVTGIVSTIALLFAYITLEDPNNYIDKLTGCGNSESLQGVLQQWNPNKDVKTVLFLQLSQFSFVSSLYGYDDANILMRNIARFLEDELGLRQTFHLERDLFAVVISGSQNDMVAYERKISQRMEEEWKVPHGTLACLDKAMVVCQYPSYFTDYSSLIEIQKYLFDYAKYHIESRVVYASDRLMEKCRRWARVEKALQNAISGKSLEVFYQPIYDNQSGKIHALEALSRLYDEELGYIAPDEFISIAEENGSILPMGKLVFEKVCSFLHYKLIPMENCPVEKIEVNLSPLQCMHSNTIPEFLRIMDKYKIPPRMINFEITESATTDSPNLLKKIMQELVESGLSFSLDDYGTGYSNISYLVHLPFEFIKFDKQLVWSYFSDPTAHAVMKKEFELIRILHKEIIAEGIEDIEQYRKLSERGIHFFQGYYFSQPVPEDECVAYLKQPLPVELQE